MRLKANAAFVTDTGRVRKQNQDAAQIAQNAATGWPIFVVADGMGGHAAGEIAAGLAIAALTEMLTDPAGPADPDARLRAAIREAERRIQEAIADNAANQGMGTTCLVGLLVGQSLHLGHIGDSRAYHFSGGQLEQLTADHSWVNEQVQAGLLAPTEAARHPLRHVITRALGPSPVEPDLIHRDLLPGDWLLLCTDGLTGPVNAAVIAETLAQADHPEVAARRLVELANEAGGPDNVTALLVRLELVEPEPVPPVVATPVVGATRRRRPAHHWAAGAAVVLIALVISVIAFLARPSGHEDPVLPVATPASPGLPPGFR